MPGLLIRSIAETAVWRGAKKTIPPESGMAYDLVLAWFLRLWFLERTRQDLAHELLALAQDPDCPYTLFQLIRLVFETGIHEPGAKGRVVQGIGDIPYVCAPLEPTSWWIETLGGLEFETWRLIPLLSQSRQDLATLFPQYLPEEFESLRPTNGSDKNALRFKMFCAALDGQQNPSRAAVYDPSLIGLSSHFPPEGQTREYKATFRWDSAGQQKNRRQQMACIKAICGMLNARGGTLIIGVDDSGQVVGLEGDFSLIGPGDKADAFTQVLHEAVKNSIDPVPAGLVAVHIQPYGLTCLAVVQVQPSPHRHTFADNGEIVAPVRDGNRTLTLRGAQAEVFLNQSS